MKCILLTVAIFFISSANTFTFGQKLDSIKYSNGHLYYHDYGKGEPVIILAGGPGISCEYMEDVALEVGKNYRAILFEQRGTGRSIPVPLDSTTINLKSAHEDLILLFNHLQLKDAIFFGHSWGAGLALSFAVNYPDRVRLLILVDIGPVSNLTELRQTMVLNRKVRYGIQDNDKYDSFNSKIKAGTMTRKDSTEYRKLGLLANIYDKQNVEAIYLKIERGETNYQTQNLMIHDLDRIKFDLSDKLSNFKNSVYAICGRQDPLAFDTYELKILYPKTLLFWVQQSGHFPMYEQPDNFYKILNKIMSKE